MSIHVSARNQFRQWCCILAFCCAVALSTTAVNGEIPINPAARTLAQTQQADARFLHRILTEAYLAGADRDSALDESMLRLLAETERCLLIGHQFLSRDELKRLAAALVRAQSDHALVSFAGGFAHGFASHTPSETQLQRAMEKLPAQGYSPYLAAKAAQTLETIYRRDRQPDRHRQMNQRGRQFLMQWLTTQPDDWKGDGLDRLIAFVEWYTWPAADTTDDWQNVDEFVTNLADQGVDAWLVEYARGHAALRKAWSARGGGFASKVREDQWRRYHQQLRIASGHLQQAHLLAPTRAEAAEQMIEVCYGNLDDPDPLANPRYWFEQAVSREFDCLGAYGGMALTLLPRWGGSQQRLLDFARECADTGRYDTLVPDRALFMARLIGDDDENEGGYAHLRQLNVFPLVRQVLDGYIGHEIDPARRRFHVSELLLWCHLLDQPEAAREVWSQLDGPFDREVLSYFRGFSTSGNQFTDLDLLTLVARGGEARELIDRAIAAEHDQAYDLAIAAYRQVLDHAAADDNALRLARHRLAQLTWRQGFESGQWTSLTFDEQLSGWITQMGTWRRIDDRTVEGVTDPRGLRLMLDLDIGRRFEVRGMIRFVHKVKPKFFNAGILFANQSWAPMIRRGILLVRDSGELQKIGPSSNVPALVAKVSLGDEVQFCLRVADDMAWVAVDGQPVHSGALLEDSHEFFRQSQLCLGGDYLKFAGTTIHFANIEVRRVND